MQRVLRGAGVLTIDEVLERVAEIEPIQGKKPRQTVLNALAAAPLTESAGYSRYVYLPTFIVGASMRIPMDSGVTSPERGLLAISAEIVALLAPRTRMDLYGPNPPALSLDGGPTVTPVFTEFGWRSSLFSLLGLPAPFWQWWETQQVRGADALLLRCLGGEAGRYTVGPLRGDSLDRAAIDARNAALQDAAIDVLKRTHHVYAEDLARRVLAHGVYHQQPAPDPLRAMLFDPARPFVVEWSRIAYRPHLTPAIKRIFASRLTEHQQWEERLVAEAFGLAPPSSLAEEAAWERERMEEERQRHAARIATRASMGGAGQWLRIKVRLEWDRKVWRVIEVADGQTLEDLHDAIQAAFHWDDDHLYAFSFDGDTRDGLTEVQTPGTPTPPPSADELTLGDLELQRGQRFLYVFDFGDNLRHELEVLDVFPAPTADATNLPRIVETHGEAPPQYDTWDDQGD